MLGIGKALSNATSALGVDINDKIFGEIQRTFGGRFASLSRALRPLAGSGQGF